MSSRDNYTFENQSSIPANLGPKLTAFFKAWDDERPEKDEYLRLFAPNGKLIFGSTPATGHDAIRAMKTSMVHPANGPVVKLQHTLGKCFAVAGGSNSGRQEIIVNGSVWYELKNGRRVDADFASWIVFADNGEGELQAEYYQVYTDTLGLTTAILEMSKAPA